MWQLLDGVLGKDGPYLLGRDFSAIDMFLVKDLKPSYRTSASPFFPA